MKILKKQALGAIALVLMLIATALMASLEAATAEATTKTIPYLSVSPKLIGLEQSVLINAWITPAPDINQRFSGYYFDITKPNGATVTMGPYTSEPAGTVWFTYTPDQLGNYSVVFRWDGGNNTVDYNLKPVPPKHLPYEPATSPPVKFTVQQEAPPTYPAAPLPTGYWERPITSEYREWSQIAGGGNWLYPTGFGDTWRPDDLGNSRVNPYSTGPNSAHIAWVLKDTLGGMYGGEYGEYNGPDFSAINVIISGVGYYQLNGLHAIDIRTGKELWVNTAMTANPTFGQPGRYVYTPDVGSSVTTPYLWVMGDTAISRYSAETGALVTTYPGEMNASNQPTINMFTPDGGVLIYISALDSPPGTTNPQHAASGRGHYVTLWNSSAPGTTFASKIVWRNPGITVETRGYCMLYKDVIVETFHPSSKMVAWNAITGALLWNVTRDSDDVQIGNGAVGYGMYFWPSTKRRAVVAVDIYSGREVWTSASADYPWGSFWSYDAAVAYDKVYFQNYDGHIFCYDAHTGKTVWKYYAPDPYSETPYNEYPFYDDIVVADGKVYTGTTEHSPTEPYYRGRKLYCLNATTGDLIWSIAGQYPTKRLADGVLVAVDQYTGQQIGYGKGQTAVTVSAPQTTIANGSSVLIQGTVTDQSLAQPGTPAISDESMTAWMEYLHMNRPIPGNATGVPVKLTALDPNGNTEDVGTVTSDMSGSFSTMWTPPVPGKYTIIATFEGSESYWASYAETAMGVSEAPPPTPAPEAAPDYTPLFTGIIAAVVVAIVIGLVNLVVLRRRK